MYSIKKDLVYLDDEIIAKIAINDSDLIEEIIRRLNGENPRRLVSISEGWPLFYFEHIPDIRFGCSRPVLSTLKSDNKFWKDICDKLNEPVKIYTSYFANVRNLPEDVCPISISGKAPTGWKGLQYKKLAPKYTTWFKYTQEGGSWENYTKEYFSLVLDKLDPRDTVNEILKLSDGKIPCLVCYETPDKFCHRQLVRDWLNKYVKVVINEFNNNK